MQHQVVLYKNKFEVAIEKDTVWLTQKQMSELFDTERSVITKHIRNIFCTKELNRKSVCAKFAHTAEDGKTYQTFFYNLDMIISVGYRINSKKGTQFRIWATNILKQHLIEGFTVNEQKLKSQSEKLISLKKVINLLDNVKQLDYVSGEIKGLIQVISDYSRALGILDDYDHQRLIIPVGTKGSSFILTYQEAVKVIQALKKKFRDSLLVGMEKDDSLKGTLGAIYQTFNGKEVYPTLEEKAAHLLYFVTKNHSFVDGNKRIAAALFICFIYKNGILWRADKSRRIDDNSLAAITLMIAASNPSEKEIMIKVILNLLT